MQQELESYKLGYKEFKESTDRETVDLKAQLEEMKEKKRKKKSLL